MACCLEILLFFLFCQLFFYRFYHVDYLLVYVFRLFICFPLQLPYVLIITSSFLSSQCSLSSEQSFFFSPYTLAVGICTIICTLLGMSGVSIIKETRNIWKYVRNIFFSRGPPTDPVGNELVELAVKQ